MNILIISWRDIANPLSGGAEILTHQWAKYWLKSGHRVTVFTAAFKGSKSRETIDRISIIRRGNQLSFRFWAFGYYLKNRKTINLVIDQVHGIPAFALFYAGKKTIALVPEVAGKIWDYEFPFPFNILGKLAEIIYIKIYKNIPFITISASTKTALEKLGCKNVYSVTPGNITRPLKALPEKSRTATVMVLGRLVRMKRIEHIIKGFSILNKNLNAKLWIAGSGPVSYRRKLQIYAHKLRCSQQIKFWGNVTQAKKLELLKKSWCLISASVCEGWGLAVIEAASCATPAVTYAVPGLKDSVKDGITGIIASENTPLSLAKALKIMLTDKKLREKLSLNCLSYAGQFDWDKSARSALKVIESLPVNSE